MTTPEVIHLVGDFSPEVLERWTRWAERTHRTIRVTTFAELEHMHDQPCVILDTHGLNDLHLPGNPS